MNLSRIRGRTPAPSGSASSLGVAAVTGCMAAMTLHAQAQTAAQGFSLESAVIDSRTSKSLGVTNESGQLADFFKAQKTMTFGILRAAGVSLDQLSPEVRARIERFQTTNLDAFRAFSQGLDLKDQGRYVEAKEAFQRAVDLDPGFALAAEQRQSMPDVNVSGSVQMRAVIAAVGAAAVDRGKQGYAIDLAHAVAAIQSGATVIATVLPVSTEQAQNAIGASEYTSNPPGSGSQFLPNLAAGLSYTYANATAGNISIATVNEWTGDKYVTNGSVLESVGTSGDFLAQRLSAANANQANATLPDGTKVYWGSWLSAPGASAAVTVSGQALTAPTLGQVDYVFAEATRQMPTSGTATFTPVGGSLTNTSGTISVDFVTRNVGVNNLGFTINGLGFAGLNGSASYSTTVASGAFQGNYTSGTCTGCAAFTPLSSVFSGNFIGQGAQGLIFSTILLTGSGTASGVHAFSR